MSDEIRKKGLQSSKKYDIIKKYGRQSPPNLPVAQLDSASDSDSEGRRFESCRVGQKEPRAALPYAVLFELLDG